MAEKGTLTSGPRSVPITRILVGASVAKSSPYFPNLNENSYLILVLPLLNGVNYPMGSSYKYGPFVEE